MLHLNSPLVIVVVHPSNNTDHIRMATDLWQSEIMAVLQCSPFEVQCSRKHKIVCINVTLQNNAITSLIVLITSQVVSPDIDSIITLKINCFLREGEELAQLVRAQDYGTLGTGVRILVMAITFNCTAIHFPVVYNLQGHQRPVPHIPCLYGVGG